MWARRLAADEKEHNVARRAAGDRDADDTT
jgi:hypothetical protein